MCSENYLNNQNFYRLEITQQYFSTTMHFFAHSKGELFSSPPKTMSVSGAPVKGNADFPTEAVQSFHDKPQPTHDSRHASKPNIIHQPRK
jgi:hypothetical protein